MCSLSKFTPFDSMCVNRSTRHARKFPCPACAKSTEVMPIKCLCTPFKLELRVAHQHGRLFQSFVVIVPSPSFLSTMKQLSGPVLPLCGQTN